MVASPASQIVTSGRPDRAKCEGRILPFVRLVPGPGVWGPRSPAEQRERADPTDRFLMTHRYGNIDPYLRTARVLRNDGEDHRILDVIAHAQSAP